jgi:hypothetical protein
VLIAQFIYFLTTVVGGGVEGELVIRPAGKNISNFKICHAARIGEDLLRNGSYLKGQPRSKLLCKNVHGSFVSQKSNEIIENKELRRF